jgi:hypothetical protein
MKDKQKQLSIGNLAFIDEECSNTCFGLKSLADGLYL